MVLTWEAKVVAVGDAVDVAETNWKHNVTPNQGDLIKMSLMFLSSQVKYQIQEPLQWKESLLIPFKLFGSW